MGSASRQEKHSPQRLAEKLLQIRKGLSLSQNELLRLMGNPDSLQQASISGYELGSRQPPLLILIKYAELANVYVEVLIKDDLDLPDKLPIETKNEDLRSTE